MASSIPSSSSSSSMKYDVFLSFSAEDTGRPGFTGHLFESLQASGLYTFMDLAKEEMWETIDPCLLSAIQDSTVCVVVLSEHYTHSRRRLRELAKLVELKKKMVPIFYKVDPSDVRKQQGPFGVVFNGHKESSGLPLDDKVHVEEDYISEWKRALKAVGSIQGYHIQNEHYGNEAQLIKQVVKLVFHDFRGTPLDVAEHPVGIDSRVQQIMGLLNLKDKGVKIVGICGMGGIGKTTLAKAVYNKICKHFDAGCLLMDIREQAQSKQGLVNLQKQVISKVLNLGNPSISNVDEGIAKMKMRLGCRSVLLVLDDIDDREQIKALAGGHNWFGARSRVIITTRNKQMLNILHGGYETYNVEELNMEEALQLFCWYAFGRNEPINGFEEISTKLVEYAAGIPLVVELWGSGLHGKTSMEFWKEMLEKLRTAPPDDIQKKLEISYDNLEHDRKVIFLDILCFFVGEKTEYVIDLLNGCGFHARLAMDDLVNKSLMKIVEDDEIWMHDQVRDMGRNIIRKDSALNPGRRSRLHDVKEVCSVLDTHVGTETIEGITLSGRYIKEMKTAAGTNFSTDAFADMSNLRLLLLHDVNLQGDFSKMPNSLILLRWSHCSLKSLPTAFNLKRIGSLDLRYSPIVEIWSQNALRNKVFYDLRYLVLTHCTELTIFPDFCCMPNLLKLKLEFCNKLACIPVSIGKLTSLVELHINQCSDFKELPHSIGNVKTLTKLIVMRTRIEELPSSIGCLINLRVLNTQCSKFLEGIPETIGQLTGLEELDFSLCPITSVPDSIGNLKNLSKFMLATWTDCHPDWIWTLDNLRILSFSMGAFSEDSVHGLTKIEELNLGLCQNLSPALGFANSLKNLFKLEFCAFCVEEIPPCVGSFENLKILAISFTPKLKCLPETLGNLSKLETLTLTGYKTEAEDFKLRSLPDSIGNLQRLSSLYLDYLTIEKLPDSIARLKELKEILITECRNLRGPLPLWEMKGMKTLTIISSEVDVDDETSHNYKDAMEVSGCSRENQEYRRVIRTEDFVLLPNYNEWELLLEVGNDKRAIQMVTLCEFQSKKWLNLIFSDDFVVESIRISPVEVNKWTDVINKVASFCPCLLPKSLLMNTRR